MESIAYFIGTSAAILTSPFGLIASAFVALASNWKWRIGAAVGGGFAIELTNYEAKLEMAKRLGISLRPHSYDIALSIGALLLVAVLATLIRASISAIRDANSQK